MIRNGSLRRHSSNFLSVKQKHKREFGTKGKSSGNTIPTGKCFHHFGFTQSSASLSQCNSMGKIKMFSISVLK